MNKFTLLKSSQFIYSTSRSVNIITAFVDSIKRQVKENKEFTENINLLSEQGTKISESQTIKLAKDAMSQTSSVVSSVSESVSKTLDSPLVKPIIQTTGKILHSTTTTVINTTHMIADPILDTQAAKTVASGVKSIQNQLTKDSNNSLYMEYLPKEIRDKERLDRFNDLKTDALKLSATGIPTSFQPILPDNEASSIVMHKSSRMENAWKSFKEKSIIGKKLFNVSKSIEESDNPILERMREFWSNRQLSETEHAKVIRLFRSVDPSFREDKFLNEMTRYVIPDIVEACLSENVQSIKEWLSDTAFAKLSVEFGAAKEQGLHSDSKLLDIIGVNIRKLSLLENDIPILLISFSTDEILLYRNKKKEIVLGNENAIQRTMYNIAFTKVQLLDSEVKVEPKTNGWIIIDMHKGLGW